MCKSIVLLLLSLSFCFALEKTRYDKYKVVRVQIDDVNQLHVLKKIETNDDSYNFWESPKHVGTFTDLVIPPHKLNEFESFSTKFELKVETIIDDLQSVIDNEKVGGREDELDWEAYYPLEAIYKWVSMMSQQHSKYVTTFEIGKTYEDRPILGLKISYKSGNPGIFIESNIHARWKLINESCNISKTSNLTFTENGSQVPQRRGSSTNSLLPKIRQFVTWQRMLTGTSYRFSMSMASITLTQQTECGEKQENPVRVCVSEQI